MCWVQSSTFYCPTSSCVSSSTHCAWCLKTVESISPLLKPFFFRTILYLNRRSCSPSTGPFMLASDTPHLPCKPGHHLSVWSSITSVLTSSPLHLPPSWRQSLRFSLPSTFSTTPMVETSANVYWLNIQLMGKCGDTTDRGIYCEIKNTIKRRFSYKRRI